MPMTRAWELAYSLTVSSTGASTALDARTSTEIPLDRARAAVPRSPAIKTTQRPKAKCRHPARRSRDVLLAHMDQIFVTVQVRLMQLTCPSTPMNSSILRRLRFRRASSVLVSYQTTTLREVLWTTL